MTFDFRTLWLAVCVLSAVEVWADDAVPVIIPSKATTFFTEPLDAEGYVDFHAALNREYGRGVSAENNAAIPLLRAMGPDRWQTDVFDLVLKELGQPPLVVTDQTFVDESTWLSQRNADQRQSEMEMFARCRQTVWKREEFPLVAELLDRNASALAEIAVAVQRPQYFRPLVRKQPTDTLLTSLLPDVQRVRDVARQLQCRSMLALGQEDFAAAQADLLTLHRLGRHISQGATLIEGLVGIALDTMAMQAAEQFAIHPAQTSERLQEYRRQLAALPPFADMVRKIDVGERSMGLDAVQALARGNRGDLKYMHLMTNDSGNEDRPQGLVSMEALAKGLIGLSLDWNAAMETMNRSYDELAALMKLSDRRERLAIAERFQQRIEQSRQQSTSFQGLVSVVLSGSKSRGRNFGETLSGLLIPAVANVGDSYDRRQTRQQLLDVLLAAADYRCEHGEYPQTLDELVPTRLPTVPLDLYTGQSLQYRRDEQTLLIYSVGKNGVDNGGRQFKPQQGEDDIVVSDPVTR